MAGYDNIKDHGFDKMSAERQRKMASMGGKACQAANKRRKTVKELFRAIGDLRVNDKDIQQRLDKLGIAREDQTWEMAVAASALVKAMRTDNPKMLEFVLELLNVDNNNVDGDGNG